jgi:hypothetical protein
MVSWRSARDRGRAGLGRAAGFGFGCAHTVSDMLDAHFGGPLRLDPAPNADRAIAVRNAG